MSKLTKNQKAVIAKYDAAKEYKLAEACELVKELTYTKFDASVELHVNLGVDPRKANQMVRGVVTLPNGTGKVTRVLVLCTPDKENEAREAGADYVGLDEYIEKIKGGWTDVDVIICTPSVMAKVGIIGRILGPRGLMPNPKTGTVTMEVGKAVKEVKAGKIDFKVDKTGIVHAALGSKGLNIMDFCKQFNARTQESAGKVLPVVITVYSDKSFTFVVKQPPVAVQLKEAAKISAGSAEPNRKKVGTITWEQVRAIAESKMPDMNCFTLESAMTMVAGTARSMGIKVEGEFPEL